MMDWMDEAVCVETDPDMFFPDRGGRDGAKAAKRVCASCPVVEQCLEYAISNGFNDGIFGGMTPGERSAVKRVSAPVLPLKTRERIEQIEHFLAAGMSVEAISGALGVSRVSLTTWADRNGLRVWARMFRGAA